MSTYRLLDSGGFRKLEEVGPFRVVRPAPSAVWNVSLEKKYWQSCDAEFERDSDGSGQWKIKNKKLAEPFLIQIEKISFQIKLTSFGHLGLFPEQLQNWKALGEWVGQQKSPVKVLNLFAYTGGSTLFCARAGAEVTHVDASKGTVKWASENAKASGLEDRKVRWLVDDVKEFVARELRRESKYNAIILDPPSYGKGDKKQVWKIEKDLMPLLEDLKKLIEPNAESLVCLSAHSEGYSPVSLSNQLARVFGPATKTAAQEMLIPDTEGFSLPSGASAIWYGQLS